MISPQVSAVLLDAYADTLPAPVASRMWAENESGLTASLWHTCTKCNGEREVQWKGRTVGCDRCNSAGGWMTDAYSDSAERVGAAQTDYTRPVLHVRCCWCDGSGVRAGLRCFGCDGDGERPANTPEEDSNGNGAIHPALVKAGAALTAMAGAAPGEWKLLVQVHLLAVPVQFDPDAYGLALEVHAATLGPAFRPPRWAVLAATVTPAARGPHSNGLQRARRDAEARRLAGLGWSAAAIARRLGVHRATIGRILAA